MRKRKHLIILLLIFSNLYSQVGGSVDMFPKSPDATSLSKHIDIPPGNFTGVADFTIPLYTIDLAGTTIPIELRYTTTGIKVGEIASRVGLGWALNTGASLSQQVIGNYDLRYLKPVLRNSIPSSCILAPYAFDHPCGIALSAVGLPGFYINYKPDLLPDIFSYSLLNGSGTFIMDYQGNKGIPRPFNLIKINSLGTSYITGMEMIDEKGFKYIFSADTVGSIQSYNTCNLDLEPDAVFENPDFKIEEIIAPSSQNIIYKYGKNPLSKYITSVTEQYPIYQVLSSNGSNYSQPMVGRFCANYTISREPALTEIIFKGGRVLFYYNNDAKGSPEGIVEELRQDLFVSDKSDIYLTRIIVENESNNIIKDYSLKYKYFTSNDDIPSPINSYIDSSLLNGLKKRLVLTEVKNNLASNSYLLSYYENPNGQTLPNRISFAQDYWGVYNGKTNSTSVPTVNAKNQYGEFHDYPGANKDPDINFGILGNLKEIKYPTGGYTKIEYEADDYFSAPETETISNNLSYEALLNEPKNFDISQNTSNKKIIFIKTGSGSTPIGSCGWKLTKSGTNVSSGDTNGTFPRTDTPGNYTLSITPSEFSDGVTCKVYYEFEELETVIISDSLKIVGTIRVSKIESNNGINNKIIRKYNYKVPGSNNILSNKTSGFNKGEEKFVPLSYDEIPIGPEGVFGDGRYVQILKRINNPGWQINTVRGKAVGYEYVQEEYIADNEPTNSYRKDYKFKINEYGNSYDTYSPVNISWPINSRLDDGLPLSEKLVNSSGKLVLYKEYEYEYDSYFNQFATMNLIPTQYNEKFANGLQIKIKNWGIAPSMQRAYQFTYVNFPISNYWIKNVKTTTIDYVNDQPSVVTEQTTAYSTNSGQNRHTFPESQSNTIIGSGIISSQNYKYAHDTNNYLKEKNIISIPLEIEVKKNGLPISKTETQYPVSQRDANTQSSGLPLPLGVSSMDLQSSTKSTEIIYDQYDNKGNLLQYTLKPDINGNNGIPVTIIWGYNQTQPIAKIEGAKLSDIPQTLINSIVNTSDYTNANYSELTLLGQLDAFRIALPNFQISTYTYKPLIGVTTITTPSGIREYYFYDTANRLESVKTNENGVLTTLKEYQYHYKP